MMKRLTVVLLALSAVLDVVADGAPESAAAAAPSSIQTQASRFAGMYFAPMCGFGYYRLRDPQVGMIEFRQDPNGSFHGAGGWSAKLHGKGESISIFPPAGDPGHGFEFVFAGGEPVRFGFAGKTYKMTVDATDQICHGQMPVMWDETGSKDFDLLKKKWPGRFTLFYTNPNRTAVLFASLTLVFFALFLYATRRWVIAAGALGTAVAAVFTVLPLSRAALLASAIAVVLLVVGRFFQPGGRKRIWVSVALALALGLGFVCKGGFDRLSFQGNKGDRTRELVWKAVPQMMSSAPWGVAGTYVGRYYTDWFKPLKANFITGSVINSHFDVMIKTGWIGSFFWMFGWFGGLLSLALWARRGGSALPVAMWTMFGVAGVFNPVLNSWTLWLIPLAVLVPFFKSRPWLDWRGYGLALAIGAVLAGGSLWYCLSAGARLTEVQPTVKTCGARVFVNGKVPKVWVVDDGETLGWVQAAKEIRYFYAARPKSPAMGFVRDLKLVPPSVRRLVVAGRNCREYLELFKKGEAPRAKEIIFISPPFGVNEIPLDLYATCAFRLLLGEFAQRYVDVYGDDFSPSWVVTVPGAELYVPGWVGYALAEL